MTDQPDTDQVVNSSFGQFDTDTDTAEKSQHDTVDRHSV
jgi:hypothetical protein